MRKLTALLAASVLSLGVIVGVAGAVTAPNTQLHFSITHKKSQYFHVQNVGKATTAKCKLDSKAWYTCGLGGETVKNLKKGLHTFRAKACNGRKCDATPASKTWRVN
jgi:hypothetical protein